MLKPAFKQKTVPCGIRNQKITGRAANTTSNSIAAKVDNSIFYSSADENQQVSAPIIKPKINTRTKKMNVMQKQKLDEIHQIIVQKQHKQQKKRVTSTTNYY